jgi:hypothetical protein
VCSRCTCGPESQHDGSITYTAFPAVHADVAHGEEHVKSSCISVFRIKPGVGASVKTFVDLYTQLNFTVDSARVAYDKLCRPLTVRAVSQVSSHDYGTSPLIAVQPAYSSTSAPAARRSNATFRICAASTTWMQKTVCRWPRCSWTRRRRTSRER